MERPATVARSNLADGETNVNRLRIPEIGIAAFYVTAGSKSSKTHLQPGAKAPAAAAAAGTDEFHFVPEHESVKLEYELDDPGAVITELKLEIFKRFETDPIWKIDLHKLGPTWLYHGKHEVTWDGRLIKEAELPGTVGDKTTHDLTKVAAEPVKDKFDDGYITLEHSPYKLKLTATSSLLPKKPVVAWTYLQILLKSIEIELGPEEAIPKISADRLVMDKAVRKQIEKAGVPKKGGSVKFSLPSNLFKTNATQMDDNTAFDVYKTLWDEGANIPLVAKIRLADSKGGEVKLEKEKGAVALGGARFLWEWEDPDEVATNGAGKPRDFIDAAINYYKAGTDARSTAKDHTYPKGDNCHVDRGGKRGPDAKPVFPDQDGYTPAAKLEVEKFPFKVEPCKERKWAAYSRPWTKGKLAGQTGALFQPSRMAGDDYRVKVYLAWDHDKKGDFVLDVKTEPLPAAPAIQAETGVFHVRRQIDLVRYVRKKSSIDNFLKDNLGGIVSAYALAYIDVIDKIGGDDKYIVSDHKLKNGTALDYNATVETAIGKATDALVKDHYASDAAANHAGEDCTFKIRKFPDFVRNVHSRTNGAAGAGDEASLRAANPGKTGDEMMTSLGTMAIPNPAGLPTGTPAQIAYKDYMARLWATQQVLKTNNVRDDREYSLAMTFNLPRQDLLEGMEILAGGKKGAAADGITILHFNYIHNVIRDRKAAGLGGAVLQGEAADVKDASLSRCVFVFYQSDLATFNHEVGHHLFLPHSRYHGPLNTAVPGGSQDARHDDDDSGCTMSYSDVRPAFCGLCQLRLRGWSALALDKDDAKNKKP